MEVIFTSAALNHLEEWRRSGNKNIQNKIKEILNSIEKSPLRGSESPKP